MVAGDDNQNETENETSDAGSHVSPFAAEQNFELAWLQVRMCWQSVKTLRLDQKKKDAVATLIQHYLSTGVPDRSITDFQQVLERLQEEHELRLKELARDERRSRKFQNAVIQVVRDNNAARLQYCRDRTEETPPIIAEWRALMASLFGAATAEPIAE